MLVRGTRIPYNGEEETNTPQAVQYQAQMCIRDRPKPVRHHMDGVRERAGGYFDESDEYG